MSKIPEYLLYRLLSMYEEDKNKKIYKPDRYLIVTGSVNLVQRIFNHEVSNES